MKAAATDASDSRGVVVVPCRTPDGIELVHVLNVAPWRTSVTLERDGHALLDAPVDLPARAGAWVVRAPGERYARVAFVGMAG